MNPGILGLSWAPHFWLIQTHKYDETFPKVAFINNAIAVTKPLRVQGSRPVSKREGIHTQRAKINSRYVKDLCQCN